MGSFDWYISPAEAFNYENQFKKLQTSSTGGDSITIAQMDPLFKATRGVDGPTFLLIWQLLDIKQEQRLNKTQFIYFAHILNALKKGRPMPIGLPLEVKERFLSGGDGDRGLSRPMHRIPNSTWLPAAPAPTPPSSTPSRQESIPSPPDLPIEIISSSKWDSLPTEELKRQSDYLRRKRDEKSRALLGVKEEVEKENEVAHILSIHTDRLHAQMMDRRKQVLGVESDPARIDEVCVALRKERDRLLKLDNSLD